MNLLTELNDRIDYLDRQGRFDEAEAEFWYAGVGELLI